MNKSMISLLLVATVTLQSIDKAAASTPASLKEDASKALSELYQSSTDTTKIANSAKAVLVFPDVKKIGFLAGLSYGEGVLFKNGQAINYYTTKSGSWGLQAGGQRFSYALFFMTDDAMKYLERSDGWELGVGPSLVVGDTGFAKKISTTTVKSDIHAVIFNQHGLMAGAGVEGNKIAVLKW